MKPKMKKTTRGGPRSNAGRKKLNDNKKQVYFFIKESIIAKHGGMEGIKQKMLLMIPETMSE